jgi:hypothetical protein
MSEEIKKVEESKEKQIEGLIAKMATTFPEQAKQVSEYLHGLRDKNVAILGEDESFKLMDQSGEIRAFKSMVRLQGTDGTLVQIGGYGPYVVSAQGYTKLEEAAGVIAMFAPKVLVEGEWKDNPYVQRDPETKRILAIYCRAIAFRFTSKGIPQVSDRTTIFDIPAYRLIDLLSKAKDVPQAFKLLPVELKPQAKENEVWAHYSFDENTILWVNTAHAEALKFYSQIINREKKAMEFAQTFSKRNAVKHLLGVQKVPGQDGPGGKTIPKDLWDVPVTCWRPTSGGIVKWDASRYAMAQRAIAKIAEGDSSPIAVLEGTDYMSEEVEVHGEIEAGEKEEPENVTPEPKKLADPLPEEPQTKKEDDIQDYPPPEKSAKPAQPEKFESHKPKEEEPPLPPEPPAKKKEEPKPKPRKEPPAGDGLNLKMEKQPENPVFAELRDLQKQYPEFYAQAQRQTGIGQIPKTSTGAGVLLHKVKELANKQK